MRALLLATLAALALGCSHAGTSGATLAARGLRHAVLPVETGPELQDSPLVAMFEQSFCSALFELNDKQVVCADDVRSVLRMQAERATLGAESTPVDDLEKELDAPRRVTLKAVKSGAQAVFVATVLDRTGKPLGKFEERVADDGTGLPERARHLGESVLSVP